MDNKVALKTKIFDASDRRKPDIEAVGNRSMAANEKIDRALCAGAMGAKVEGLCPDICRWNRL